MVRHIWLHDFLQWILTIYEGQEGLQHVEANQFWNPPINSTSQNGMAEIHRALLAIFLWAGWWYLIWSKNRRRGYMISNGEIAGNIKWEPNKTHDRPNEGFVEYVSGTTKNVSHIMLTVSWVADRDLLPLWEEQGLVEKWGAKKLPAWKLRARINIKPCSCDKLDENGK